MCEDLKLVSEELSLEINLPSQRPKEQAVPYGQSCSNTVKILFS